MRLGKNTSRGFTLIAALLILVLLSGVAAGLLYMVTNESKMGGNDLESNLAYYGAESGMEKLTSDLSSLYSTYMNPLNSEIQGLTSNPPTSAMVPNMTYNETITYPLVTAGCTVTASNPCTCPSGSTSSCVPASSWNTISQGSNQGLYAEIIPMTLQVTATRPSGAYANMTRGVEVALIPVFQFGVFCGYDCSYFAGPDFNFGGRVHTNSNLFLASGSELVFTDKVAAYKQIVMDRLENGFSAMTSNYAGTVYLPTATGGCVLSFPPTYPPTGSNCTALPGAGTVPGDASWSGGYPSIAGSANANFPSISEGTLNGFMVNSLTGATNMQLPFVQNSCTSNPPPCTDPISIIRKPQPGESATSTLGSERLYNKAEIRILLADTENDLHPGWAGDAQDYQFYTTGQYVTLNSNAAAKNTGGTAVTGNEYFGVATVGGFWLAPYGHSTWTSYPLLGELTTSSLPTNGQGAWIRVEYCSTAPCNAQTDFVGITTDWLGYGFSRQYNIAPTAPGGSACVAATASTPASCPDPINPYAIIILQQLSPSATTPVGSSGNFYPINFYDTREGEMRDNANGCAVNGIMNAVELNVGNLAKWLAVSGAYSGDVGASVNSSFQNGYVLYFSDHRGMLTDPNPSNGGQTAAGVISGESGLEDVVNSSQPLTSTTPDGALETASYYTYSPEDVDQNGYLDNWGGVNIGYGFNVNTNTSPPNPYLTVPNSPTSPSPFTSTSTGCNTYGQANAVSGARHVLKLVAGGMSSTPASYLPMPGFTVASENPVYVQGNYNTSVSDPFWTAGTTTATHSNASIIADSVTLLSNATTAAGWNDLNSLNNPTTLGNRNPTDTYYRLAISAGKNIPFPQPTFSGVAKDFGTDGGLHNFLRLLENWGATLSYNGSLVSMYYSEYNTGTFKCCTTVYSAPTRNFYFDTQFLNPATLPPATPMFQNVVDLSYHQNFTPH
jgi:Tfp pilus assembly protein PilX